ncbi:MAG TPA: transglutaminase-like domain-containing protein [Chitinophagaceae bacterium]|nr:transglutaminase-like domain-containing protein [Chitinophagaceae bacterium]
MKIRLFIFLIALNILTSQAQGLTKNYQVDTSNLENLAKKIIGSEKSNVKKTDMLLKWVYGNIEWLPTDYAKRTVNQILARGGGNCFEMAEVYMALLKTLKIKYRAVKEINIHRHDENRQTRAEDKVNKYGYGMSIFGRGHNDHRWVEVYDSTSFEWVPVDPTMNIMGLKQWLLNRVGFEKRVSIDTSISNSMIVPFAIFALTDNKSGVIAEWRVQYYLIDEFDKLYDGKLSQLPSWGKWTKAITEIQLFAKQAFEGQINLHAYSDNISEIKNIYFNLKNEYKNYKQKHPGTNLAKGNAKASH